MSYIKLDNEKVTVEIFETFATESNYNQSNCIY